MTADRGHTHDSARLPLTGAVLAGGRSRRMGTDKRALNVGGKSMLARVVDVALEACEHAMVVIAQDDERVREGAFGDRVAVVRDVIPRLGPVGGLITALKAAETEWLAVVAADMPFVRAEAIRLLWEHRGDSRAVAYRGERGYEPLLALYHADCLDVALGMLTERRSSPRAVLERVNAVGLPLETLFEADPSLRSLVNVNTPNEYTEIVRGEIGANHRLLGIPIDLVGAGRTEEAFSG